MFHLVSLSFAISLAVVLLPGAFWVGVFDFFCLCFVLACRFLASRGTSASN